MKTIVIAGGGTGGHIYPGVAIARALQKVDPAVDIHFVGTANGLESKIVPREKFPLHTIQGGKLNFGDGFLFEKIKTLAKMPVGILQSLMLLTKLKPAAVIGVGGYASGPLVLASALMGIKTAIWEANAKPGMANKLLSRFVKKSYVVFDEARAELVCKELLHVGMPLRSEIEISNSKKENSEEFHVLHFGGSQGSRIIGRALAEAVTKGGDWTRNLKVVHQTGSIELQFIKEKYGTSANIEVHEFIYNMPDYYKWADVVVCRGGAGTLSELAAFGLPAIVIPLPLADGHQEKNAESLVKAGAAKMILQKDLTPELLIREIDDLRNHPEEREKMAKNIKKFYIPNAAERIAKDLLS